jgi:hypothetical protein
MRVAGREICSSLLLQQLLYYNAWLSPAWLVTIGLRVYIKVAGGRWVLRATPARAALRAWRTVLGARGLLHNARGPQSYTCARAPSANLPLQYGVGLSFVDPDIARTVLCIFWMLAEPVRLAAGWHGNLHENVSSSAPGAACWALEPHHCVAPRHTCCCTCMHACMPAQVPWLVIFAVLTLVVQTSVVYYLMLAAHVSRLARRCLLLAACVCWRDAHAPAVPQRTCVWLGCRSRTHARLALLARRTWRPLTRRCRWRWQ